jgi:hypothetical protein
MGIPEKAVSDRCVIVNFMSSLADGDKSEAALCRRDDTSRQACDGSEEMEI